MRQTILFFFLLFAGQIFAQSESKSKLLANEIQYLELENNSLILDKYINEQCDTTSNIPILKIGTHLVLDFQNTHANLKELKDEYDKITRQLDSIKYREPEYRKYTENFVGVVGEERKKQQAAYKKIFNKLYNSNKNFKELWDNGRKVLSKLNYQTLLQMTEDYHQRKEILPIDFIPYTDLRRYKEMTKVKENQRRIEILNSLYKKALENELSKKYDIDDRNMEASRKTDE